MLVLGRGWTHLTPNLARVLILTQALIRSLPHLLLAGPGGEADLHDEFRLHPVRPAPSFGIDRGKGTALLYERVQPVAQHGMNLLREAGTGTPRVDQLACIAVVAQQQRSDAAHAVRQINPAANDKLLLMDAFRLEPAGAAAGAVGRIGTFRKDAFGMQLASRVEDLGAIAGQILAEADVVRVLAQHGAQQALAFAQRQSARVMPVDVQQVEAIEGERVLFVLLERRLQAREAGQAAAVQHDDFAIKDGFVRVHAGKCCRDRLHAVRPIQAAAGVEGNRPPALVSLHAVAVQLQLMHPLRAVGRCLRLVRELRLQ